MSTTHTARLFNNAAIREDLLPAMRVSYDLVSELWSALVAGLADAALKPPSWGGAWMTAVSQAWEPIPPLSGVPSLRPDRGRAMATAQRHPHVSHESTS